jgi:hypothetical protein
MPDPQSNDFAGCHPVMKAQLNIGRPIRVGTVCNRRARNFVKCCVGASFLTAINASLAGTIRRIRRVQDQF